MSNHVFDAVDILDRLEESVALYDREARFLYANQATTRRFGKPIEELLGRRPWEIVGSSDSPRSPFRVALEAVLAGAPHQKTISYVAAFERWYEVDVYPSPGGALATARDVTQARQALEELSRSEERFRAMVELAPEAIVIFDTATGKFCDANPEAERLFGRTRAELMTLGPLDVSSATQPDGRDAGGAFAEALEKIQRGEVFNLAWGAVGAQGRELAVEVYARVLPGTNPVLVRASIIDVTSRKRAERQLAEVQRLEATARLAGGVAHDFSNLLMVIIGGTELAMSELPPGSRARESLDAVMNAAERAARVTRQLLLFGHEHTAAPRAVDLSAHVEGMRPVLQRLVGEDVQLVLDLEHPLGSTLIDPAHVEQILINLTANARDAMPHGGRIGVRTGSVSVGAEHPNVPEDIPPGRYVLLTVADTGEGIPESVRPHIFEPFFTTKGFERGTGLGLATVFGIVKANGGHIAVDSKPGGGTTFKVYLPLSDQLPAAGELHHEADARARATETILLVEDDDAVREVMLLALEHGGYTVLEASNAGEALLLCEEHQGVIDLLLTDVVMPRMSGPKLAARLRLMRPELRVVFISGYGAERLDPPTASTARQGHVAKPVGVEALLGAVRTALER